MTAKEHHISWEDIEFEEIEIRLESEMPEEDSESSGESDEDICDNMHADKLQTLKKTPSPYIYRCPECHKLYKTIYGFKKHIRTKHDKTKVNLHHCRIEKEVNAPVESSAIPSLDIIDLIPNCIKMAIANICSDEIHNMKSSVYGHDVIGVCKMLLQNLESMTALQGVIEPIFKQIFSCGFTTQMERELMMTKFHSCRSDPNTISKICQVIQPFTDQKKVAQLVVQNILCEVLKSLVRKIKDNINVDQTTTKDSLSESDLNGPYYVSGYLINKLTQYQRKRRALRDHKTLISTLSVSADQVGANRLTKMMEWTKVQDRGGLKYASDDFFSLVKEIDSIASPSASEKMNAHIIRRDSLKPLIFETFNVKHYWAQINKACGSDDSKTLGVLEFIVDTLLTLKGFALAKQLRNKRYVPTSTKCVKPSSSFRHQLI